VASTGAAATGPSRVKGGGDRPAGGPTATPAPAGVDIRQICRAG